MSVFDCTYLVEDQVKGFDNYKYSSVDTSPIAVYVSHPFWNQVVKIVPRRIAPNLLTVTGFLCVILTFLLVSYYDYYLYASSDTHTEFTPIPDWVWLFNAIFTFLAHTLDGIDGKQARRTGTSGPTGELFDHGLDSWATLPFTVTIFSIFGRDDFSLSATRLLGVVMSVQLVFIATHWEKYNTGVLFLSWGYDVSQYGLVLFYIFTYFVGYKWYKFDIVPALKINFADCFEVGFYCMCAASVGMSLYNIHHAYVIEKTGQRNSYFEGLLPLFSTTILFAVALLWALLSPTDVIDKDPRVFIWTMGVVFSNIASRLIVAQMSHTRCEPFNWLLFPYIGAFAVSMFKIGLWELYLVRALGVCFTLAHIHYGTCVVRQLCSHFGINAFTIVGDRVERTHSD